MSVVLEIRTLQKMYKKYMERFEVWYWRRTWKISWADRVKKEGLH
jgi:hypothetical protein